MKLLVWGAGGHARVVAEIAEALGYTIVGYVDDVSADRAPLFRGATVLRDRDAVARAAASGQTLAVIAVGDCRARLAIAEAAAALGLSFPILVHPRATISPSAQLAAGTVAMAGAIVNAEARIGAHCILNTAATVDHDCVLGDGVHVSPGAHLGGNVVVGTAAWIGIGASVRHAIAIGARAMVGAGAAVVKDVGDDEIVVGVPARPLSPGARR